MVSARGVGALAVALVAGVFAARPALACGGGGVTSSAGLVTNSQRVFMSVRAGGTTDIVAQVSVPQTTADYGVLIPVPGKPTIDSQPVSTQEMNALDYATAPIISKETDSDGGIGCGCGAAAGADEPGSEPNRGVVVSTTVAIGPVTAVALTGDSADAVSAWLADNGFSLPSSDSATLGQYLADGNYFIAIRRRETATPGTATSIGIHYSLEGDHRKLSLGFTRIGAASKLAFTLFLAAPQAVGPSAPFTALTLSDLSAPTLAGGNYAGAVEGAVLAKDSKAFVLESVTPKQAIESTAPGFARFIDDGAVITRATSVVQRDALGDDVVFATPFQGEVPSRRYVNLDRTRMRYASMGSLGLLILAGALRRRARERQPSGSKM